MFLYSCVVNSGLWMKSLFYKPLMKGRQNKNICKAHRKIAAALMNWRENNKKILEKSFHSSGGCCIAISPIFLLENILIANVLFCLSVSRIERPFFHCLSAIGNTLTRVHLCVRTRQKRCVGGRARPDAGAPYALFDVSGATSLQSATSVAAQNN